MSCSRYLFRYGAGGILSATYLLCGDNTPVTVAATGGVSGAFYTSPDLPGAAQTGTGVIIATTGSVTTYTGFVSAGGAPVPGFVYTTVVRPWAQYVLSTAVSAVSGNQLPYPTS